MAKAIESVATRQSRRRAGTTIPVGDRQMYGVFGPQYGAYLAAAASNTDPTASAAEAAGSAAALRMGTQNEANDYARMLSRAQDMQEQAQIRDINAEFESDIGERNLAYTKEGIGGIESRETDPITGESRIVRNPTQQSIGNVYNLNAKRAETLTGYADAFQKLQAGGEGYSLPAKRQILRDFVTGEEADLVPKVNPDIETQLALGETAPEKFNRETAKAEIAAKAKGGVKIKAVTNEVGRLMLYEISGGDPVQVEAVRQDFAARKIPTKVVAEPTDTPDEQTVSPNAGAKGGGAPATPVAADWNDYRSPKYDAVEAQLEKKYNLPHGLMKRIRVYGEKSNANAKSKKGARTVYQVTAPTRARIFERYGVDAWSSPQAAAEAAAIHLSDSIRRGQDPVREYNAGPKSRGAWNSKETRAYAARVNSGEAHAATRTQPNRNAMRIARIRTNPLVKDVAEDDSGNLVVIMQSGRSMTLDPQGRKVG